MSVGDSIPLVFLLSTGLGRIKRGFENHISTLADALASETDLPFHFEVLCGKKVKNKNYRPIFNLHRNFWLLRLMQFSWKRKFRIEQASFLLSMLPLLLSKNPSVIYLAEYDLYCWLYKLRKWFHLSYGLILYTGGMSVPGLFDPTRDKVHHVSKALLETATRMGIPISNQVYIPHFVRTNFEYDDYTVRDLRNKANDKKIVLVVGAINTNHKRMDLAVRILGQFTQQLYPVFVGDPTEESPLIESLLQKSFGKGYTLTSTSPEKVGTYYAAADFFFSASAYESFGLVYIEALWHGLKLFCHDHEGLEELLEGRVTTADMTKFIDSQKDLSKFILGLFPFPNRCIEYHVFCQKKYSWTTNSNKYLGLFGRQS